MGKLCKAEEEITDTSMCFSFPQIHVTIQTIAINQKLSMFSLLSKSFYYHARYCIRFLLRIQIT